MAVSAAAYLEKYRRRKGLLFVLSGPSGVGKDTVLERLLSSTPNLCRCITSTTRSRRDNEENGKNYWFYSIEQFKKMVEAGEFIEHALVHGNLYGTQKKHLEEILSSGKDAILLIDVQGASSIKRARPDSILIFLAPPSLEELERRLRERGSETEEKIQTRLSNAEGELQKIKDFNYLVVNDVLENAASQISAIVIAERCKIEHNS